MYIPQVQVNGFDLCSKEKQITQKLVISLVIALMR